MSGKCYIAIKHLVLKKDTEVIMKSHKHQKLHDGYGHVSLNTAVYAYVSAGRGSLKCRLDENLRLSVKSHNST